MKAAVLCNGSRRISYGGRNDYDFVIGCNIPWTQDLDATVVVDEEIVIIWSQNLNLIHVPIYFSKKAWMCADNLKIRETTTQQFAGIIDVEPNYHSSGHCAAEIAIARGATLINVYGCDGMFERTTNSYTRNFIPSGPNEQIRGVDKVNGWRRRWSSLMQHTPQTTINFIP